MPRFYSHLPPISLNNLLIIIFVFILLFAIFSLYKILLNKFPDRYWVTKMAPDYEELPNGNLKVKFGFFVNPRGGLSKPGAQIITREEYYQRYGKYQSHQKIK